MNLRMVVLVGVMSASACSGATTVQTVLRFHAAGSLSLPEGVEIRLHVWPDGVRQHEESQQLGPYPFVDDIKLTIDAKDADPSRRFTVFAELTHEGTRLSWVRVRTGFLPTELGEVQVVFGPDCKPPSDRPGDAFDSASTCGSHDSCGPMGECTPSCFDARPFDERDTPSTPVTCPESDCLAADSIASGRTYTCAQSGGEAFCWGRIATAAGWLGHPERPSRVVGPDGSASFDDNIESIDASADQVCLVTGGEVRCGGRNSVDIPLLGEGRPDVRPCCEVEMVGPGEIVVEVRTGTTATYALDTLGVLHFVGRRPGGGPASASFAPVFEGRGGVDRFVALWDDVCAIRSGNTECGFETLPALPDVRAIDGAVGTICSINSAGRLDCYGRDMQGVAYSDVPHTIEGEWSRVSLARQFIGDGQATCGIDSAGGLFCWGDSQGGRTGTTGFVPDETPFQIAPSIAWSEVAVGASHACAVTTDGEVFCWGANTDSQLGRPGPASAAPLRVCVPSY